MDTTEITLRTRAESSMLDLTPMLDEFVSARGSGLLSVFVPHATAGLAIIEVGAGSDVDLLASIDDLFPLDDSWEHRHGSRGHGRDHVLPAYLSPSVTIPVVDGRLTLGTWQSVVLVDPNADNVDRRVRFSFIEG